MTRRPEKEKNQGWRIEKKFRLSLSSFHAWKKTRGDFFWDFVGKRAFCPICTFFRSHLLLNTHGILQQKLNQCQNITCKLYKTESQGREAFPFFVCLSVVVNGKHFLEREVGGTSVYVLFFMSSNLVRASHLLLSSLYTSLPILYAELFNR